MDSTALFQVSAGMEWYIHTIYTVRSRDNSNQDIGAENNRGTNILHIALDCSTQKQPNLHEESQEEGVIPRELNHRDSSDDQLVLIIGILVGLLFTILLAVLVILVVRSRREKNVTEPPKGSNSTEPMMTQVLDSNDSSEV